METLWNYFNWTLNTYFLSLQGHGEKEMDDWIQNKLQSGKTWEGPLNCVRKTGDVVPLNTRVIPITSQGKRLTDRYLVILDYDFVYL